MEYSTRVRYCTGVLNSSTLLTMEYLTRLLYSNGVPNSTTLLPLLPTFTSFVRSGLSSDHVRGIRPLSLATVHLGCPHPLWAFQQRKTWILALSRATVTSRLWPIPFNIRCDLSNDGNKEFQHRHARHKMSMPAVIGRLVFMVGLYLFSQFILSQYPLDLS